MESSADIGGVGVDRELDEGALDRLREIGDDQFVVEMIEALFSFAPKVLVEARMGLAAGDLEPVQRMGHSLKSSARVLGIVKMEKLAIEIEARSRAKKSEGLENLLSEIEGAYASARVSLERIRNCGGKSA